MDLFIKATAGAVVALILYLILAKSGKEYGILVTVAACCMIVYGAVMSLHPVLEFVQKLMTLGKFDPQMLGIVLKSVGIGLLTEIVGLICADAGNAALGKVLQILASAVILWLSLPLFTSLITMVEEILVSI